ncbi:hypothetical protein JQ615_21555 [Bradyrhizobium jicamae]|uniref:HEPN AbiU2-like domain-containing protein n=1 Tax=Bradyrhizobium jicamae TaxID=280332 RepID=A0ABS5FMH4_9BRAD|nr:hypothetical protein [Bradyrhizobium jicamae]MBR0797980.1 hypothetical protein [Bradyrhizobium jicamae]
MQHFDVPAKALLSGDKKALLLWCYEHCHRAFIEGSRYEETIAGSLWRFDQRYYEHSMCVPYERLCYAMTMVIAQFGDFLEASFGSQFRNLNEMSRKLTTFDVFLSGAVDEVFKQEAPVVAVDDGTQKYFENDFLDDDYEAFWKANRKLLSDIAALRRTFAQPERTYIHGFSRFDYDEDDDEESWNIDCTFMKRVRERVAGDIDVDKFLGQTKRVYLPLILNAFFSSTVKTKSPWWQFWKRQK